MIIAKYSRFGLAVCFSILFYIPVFSQQSREELTADFKYAPKWWQSTIGLPDDHLKTLVGKEGNFFYDFVHRRNPRPGPFRLFKTEIGLAFDSSSQWVEQKNADPKVPVLLTKHVVNDLEISQTAFTVAPPFFSEDGGPRNDLNLITYKNNGSSVVSVAPVVEIKTSDSLVFDRKRNLAFIGDHLVVAFTPEISSVSMRDTLVSPKESVMINAKILRVTFPSKDLQPSETWQAAFGVNFGKDAVYLPNNISQVCRLQEKAVEYWLNLDFPYDKINVPDSVVQALLTSSTRNIFQAREIKNGLPSFQVGPTVYRGLWIVDGSFLLEAMTFLGRIPEVRKGIEFMMGYQNEDGSFEKIRKHWKETGIVLWAVSRHARLTGDKDWLNSYWPKVEKAFAYIDTMRQITRRDPAALNYDLIPDGYSDGGLAEHTAEYTNIYWTMAGMKAAVEAAEWLGKSDTAREWKEKYESFCDRFRKAAKRDMKVDGFGNAYLPIIMTNNDHILPQKAQWAFLHAVFPGKVFSGNEKLVKGNLDMLGAVEQEGLVYNTGWHSNGVWNYFASFHGHALLWTGQGSKTAEKLYAMANHASPTLVWREEQEVKKFAYEPVGDMPHNWASAEFIRLVRHMIALERDDQLHLFEGLPKEWTRPGMRTSLDEVYTEFGVLTVKLSVSANGKNAEVFVDLKKHGGATLNDIVMHTDGITGKTKEIRLKPAFPITYTMEIK